MNERVQEISGLAEIFSRIMKAGAIGAVPVQRRIEADAAERAGLAKLFGLQAISSLSGDFTLACTGNSGGVIDVTLALAARITQTCVISLEPFEARIAETAKLRFIPAAALREDAEIAAIDPESLEGPDDLGYSGDVVDLGAALGEQLALALDPYPRKPGAKLRPDAADPGTHPFAALAGLASTGPKTGE